MEIIQNQEYTKPKWLPSEDPLPLPTELQIKRTISRIKYKLAHKDIDKKINEGVKEGYTKAIEILTKNQVFNYDGLAPAKLKTVQGRAIVTLTIDYLAGECRQSVLCKVPIK